MPPDVSTAQLVIHVEDRQGCSAIGTAWQRVRTCCAGLARRGEQHLPLALRISDLQGHCLVIEEDTGPLTRFRLPPGTCVIVARLGAVQRSYTLTLEPGRSFDLHLDFRSCREHENP